MGSPLRHGIVRRAGVGLAVALTALPGGLIPAAASTTRAAQPMPVIVVGSSGLRWSDVTPSGTPTLWGLVGNSAVGSTQVRSARSGTCPADGWLTISAGVKAASIAESVGRDPLNPGQVATDGGIRCKPIAVAGDGRVASWSTYAQVQRELSGAYGVPGTLGERLTVAGVCATAVGPGAAVALADSRGIAARYTQTWTPKVQHQCPVTVVDAGNLSASAPERAAQLTALDALVGQVVDAASTGSHVIVTGVADPSESPPPLQVGIEHVVGTDQPSWLTSESTRGPLAIVALSDVTASVLALAGVTFDGLEGTPWQPGAVRELSTALTIEDRRDVQQLSDVISEDGPLLGAWAAVALAAVLTACLLALLARRRGHAWAGRPAFARVTVGAALFWAAIPAALYLVTAFRWWQYDHPTLALGTLSVGVAVGLAVAAAYARISAPWRYVLVLCGATFVVLTVDGVSGTALQAGSVLAAGPVYGGRFYGFGNVTFTVYATATLLLAAAVAQALLDRGHRRGAIAATLGIGALALGVDGWPGFGADFGGLIALAPGVGLVVLAVASVRLTYARLAGVSLIGVVAVAVVSFLDYQRPPQSRSHMGEFVARLRAGEADEVLANKLDALVASLTSPLGWAELSVFGLAVAVVLSPRRLRVPGLQRLFDVWPLLRPALLALAVTCAIGTVVNDSGALIAGLGVLTAAPVLIATCARSTTRPAPQSARAPVPAGRA